MIGCWGKLKSTLEVLTRQRKPEWTTGDIQTHRETNPYTKRGGKEKTLLVTGEIPLPLPDTPS